MTALLPPTPIYLLRSHPSPISTFSFSDDNERIYSGDTSGLVVVTSTSSLRAIASWKAHTDGLLGIEEWETRVITYVLCTMQDGRVADICGADMREITSCMCGLRSRSCHPLPGLEGLQRNLVCPSRHCATLWTSTR